MRHYVALILAIGLAACTEQPADEPMYKTAKADRRTIEVSVSSSGIVEPLATVEVKSKASGEVLDVMVEVGDHVERDTLLVRIDPRTGKLARAGDSEAIFEYFHSDRAPNALAEAGGKTSAQATPGRQGEPAAQVTKKLF